MVDETAIVETVRNTTEITEPEKNNQFDDLPVYKPSFLYKNNRQTFAYRLSELVFGSLLASFILGFVGFSASLASTASSDVNIIFSNYDLFVGPPANHDVEIIVPYFKWLLFIHYLLISLLFSLLTAAIYFNYHQSILFLSTDQKKAPMDFLLSLSLAVLFGIAMIIPSIAIFLVGFILLILLARKHALINGFKKDLSRRLYSSIYSSNGTANPTTDDDNDKKIRRRLEKEFAKVEDATVASWGGKGDKSTLFFAIALIALVLLKLIPTIYHPVFYTSVYFNQVTVHALLLFIILSTLYVNLMNSAKTLVFDSDAALFKVDNKYKNCLDETILALKNA